jgi:hypothetical protein
MPESYAIVYDPIDTLAYVAAKTQHSKLGTSVIDAHYKAGATHVCILPLPPNGALRHDERVLEALAPL